MYSTTAQIFSEMFHSPSAAFAKLQRYPHVWVVLGVITIGPIFLYLWYYATVDFNWLIDHTLAANPELTDEQRATTRTILTPSTMERMTIGFTFLITPLSFAILAVYYSTFGRFLGSENTYRDWFAFSVWTGLPRILLFPLMAFQIIDSKGIVALEDLTMVSLNTLLLHLPNNDSWAGFSTAIDLTLIWSYVLAVIGLRVWTGRDIGVCLALAILPMVIFYGLWATKIFVFS